MATEYLYRIVEVVHSNYDGGIRSLTLRLDKYIILKRTEKGAWIGSEFPWDKKFVMLSARKKYAHETEAEAMESFIARKKKQIKIVSYQLKKAELALQLATTEGVEVSRPINPITLSVFKNYR